jgi:hypothetical protein
MFQITIHKSARFDDTWMGKEEPELLGKFIISQHIGDLVEK